MNCIVTLFGEWIYCRNVGGEFQHIHNRVIYITYICRILVNKRLTQYGKARELKPFDEFVLFPLFLSSSCAFSLVLREVIEVVGELFYFFFFYLFCFSFFFFFFLCGSLMSHFFEWAVRSLLFSKGSQKADQKGYRF
jgi:hypothetical protein